MWPLDRERARGGIQADGVGVSALAGWLLAAALACACLRLRRRLELVAAAEHELRGPATAIGLAAAALRREPGGLRRALMFESELERMKAGLEDLAAARAGRRGPVRPVALDTRARSAGRDRRLAEGRDGRCAFAGTPGPPSFARTAAASRRRSRTSWRTPWSTGREGWRCGAAGRASGCASRSSDEGPAAAGWVSPRAPSRRPGGCSRSSAPRDGTTVAVELPLAAEGAHAAPPQTPRRGPPIARAGVRRPGGLGGRKPGARGRGARGRAGPGRGGRARAGGRPRAKRGDVAIREVPSGSRRRTHRRGPSR